MIRNMLLFAAAVLALSGCKASQVLDAGASAADAVHASAPASFADRTVLDEQAALGVELAYKAARLAMETGVDAGLIKGETARRAAELDNRAFLAVATVRQAYAAGNADSYRQALTEARGAISDLMAVKGAK